MQPRIVLNVRQSQTAVFCSGKLTYLVIRQLLRSQHHSVVGVDEIIKQFSKNVYYNVCMTRARAH